MSIFDNLYLYTVDDSYGRNHLTMEWRLAKYSDPLDVLNHNVEEQFVINDISDLEKLPIYKEVHKKDNRLIMPNAKVARIFKHALFENFSLGKFTDEELQFRKEHEESLKQDEADRMELVVISLNERTSVISNLDTKGKKLHPGFVFSLDGIDLTPDKTEPIFIVRADNKEAVAKAESSVRELLKKRNSDVEIIPGRPVRFSICDVYSERMEITVPDDLDIENLTPDEILSKNEEVIYSDCEFAPFSIETKIHLYLSGYSCYADYAEEFDLETKKELRDIYGVSEFDDELEEHGI